MISIYENTKIYIASPSKVFTGGPEALHQLCYALRKELSINCYMLYFDMYSKDDHIHEGLARYNNPYEMCVEDNEKNVLIVPEVYSGINILKNYKNIRKIIWWLSVDNYYISKYKNHPLILYNKIFRREVIDIPLIIQKKFFSSPFDNIIYEADFHLCQSKYALEHILNKGIKKEKSYCLFEYLTDYFLEEKVSLSRKKNIVVYNPLKGLNFTQKIIENAKGLIFVPIEKMKRDDVIKILKKAKVYIDFGHHPGRDRMPREAAILGCVVITGMRGSAKFQEDVPIPQEYKFEDKNENIPLIVDKIKYSIYNYEEVYNVFESYREHIRNEKVRFLEDLRKIFVKVY